MSPTPFNAVINARFLTQPITGSQRFAIELCRGLKQLRPDLLLVAPDNIMHKDLAEELDVQIVGRFKKGILWEQVELPIILKKFGYPVLINLCNMAPILYKNNIVAVLDLSFYIHPEWFSRQFSLLYNAFIPRAARGARQVITISEYSRHDIHKYFGIPLANIDIIYPNVSEVFLQQSSKNVPNKLGKYILAVSSLDPRKNFKGLIQAFKLCSLADTKLVIVGSAHKVFADNDLKVLVEGDSSIVFTGYISDEELIGLYRHALLFAYPSFFEGFGIPPLEAMACGCPTIVSNTTSLPEVCGDASVYVDPYNIQDIRDSILEIVDNAPLRDQLVDKGYEQIKKFSWQQSAEHLIYLVDQLNKQNHEVDS